MGPFAERHIIDRLARTIIGGRIWSSLKTALPCRAFLCRTFGLSANAPPCRLALDTPPWGLCAPSRGIFDSNLSTYIMSILLPILLSVSLLLSPVLSYGQRTDSAKANTAPSRQDAPKRPAVQVPRKTTDTTLKRATPAAPSPQIILQKQFRNNPPPSQQKIPLNKVQPRPKTPSKPRIKPTPVPRSRTRPSTRPGSDG